MDLTNAKLARRFLRGVTIAFLAQHLVFALAFLVRSAWVMLAVDLLCALATGAALWLFLHGKPRAHMLAVFLAQLVFLSFSAVFLGWSAGLQLPLIALTLFVFFGEYVGRTTDRKSLPALPCALLSFVVFLVVFMPRFHTAGLQPLPEDVVVTLQLIWSGAVFALCIVGVSIIVQMSNDSERLLIDQAESDKLTGLTNRAGYEQLLTRLNMHRTTLLLIDGDKFKHVNDTYGHAVGDRVLKKIALALLKNFRRIDYVCRIGGDEFAVLMLDAEKPEPESIIRKANRINRELAHNEDDGLPLTSVSVGVAYGCESADWKELFDHADAALYEVKQNGGRDCRIYSVDSDNH